MELFNKNVSNSLESAAILSSKRQKTKKFKTLPDEAIVTSGSSEQTMQDWKGEGEVKLSI